MIEVTDLTKRYGHHIAVEDLSFTADPGRITGFLGPNGAGKSTTLRILTGLQHPDAGSATIGRRTYPQLARPLAAVGVMLDAQALPDQQRPTELLHWFARSNRLEPARIPLVLAQVGLSDVRTRRIGTFSLGMRQRLALAAALLGDPGTLVLDEPANGLDPEGSRWLRGLLRELAEEGRTVLLSSHLLEEMAQIADDLIVIARGRLVAQTVPERLIAEVLGQRILVRSSDDTRLAQVLDTAGFDVVQDGEYLSVTAGEPDVVGSIAHRAAVIVHELRARSGSLEEAFLSVTGPHKDSPGHGR